MLNTSRGILQDWPLHWIHFQQLVQFVKRFGSLNHVRSSNTLTESEGKGWLSSAHIPVSTAPGKPSWANVGQSCRKLWAHTKKLLKRCYQVSFIFNLFIWRTALLRLVKVSQHTKPTICNYCQRSKWSTLGPQISMTSCFAQTFFVETRIFHLMFATISSLGLTLNYFSCDVFKSLALMCVKHFFQ